MTLRCKLGDLAIVIKSPRVPENLGVIVEVSKALGNVRGVGFSWVVLSTGRPLICYLHSAHHLVHRQEAACPDDWLMPLPALPPEQAVDTAVPVDGELV